MVLYLLDDYRAYDSTVSPFIGRCMEFIRRTLLYRCYDDITFRKAIAFLLLLKSRTSFVRNCTTNKLHTITGVSAKAIKERMKVLVANGLAEYVGKNNTLILHKIKSSSQHRNTPINIDTKHRQHTERSLRAALFVEIQRKKDFIRRVIRTAHDPHNVKEFKSARKLSNSLGIKKFIENGISYKGIAQRLHISLRTAFETVKYAIENNLVRKKRNIKQIFLKGAESMMYALEGYNCFTSHDNIYICYANTYTIQKI